MSEQQEISEVMRNKAEQLSQRLRMQDRLWLLVCIILILLMVIFVWR